MRLPIRRIGNDLRAGWQPPPAAGAHQPARRRRPGSPHHVHAHGEHQHCFAAHLSTKGLKAVRARLATIASLDSLYALSA
jgi:hypothetical protein